MTEQFKALRALEHLDGYRRLFFDPVFWTPFVEEVCRRHGLKPSGPVRGGVAGTCPAFVVGERWLVKFFGRLFDGGPSFRVELEAWKLIAGEPDIPSAPVLASGQLIPGAVEDPHSEWPWPYLVFDFIPGLSIGEQMDEVSEVDWLRVAGEMGIIIRRLHSISLAGSTIFPNHHRSYLEFLREQKAVCVQNQSEWGTLSPHLIEQIEGYLPPLEALVDTSCSPHLIHADLTRDHLLGRVENGRWRSLALIDFGDAMTGDLLYELAALHMDLFRGQKPLLSAFLNAYELPPAARRDLPRQALATSLLHRFNVFAGLSPERLQARSLDDLAQELWGE